MTTADQNILADIPIWWRHCAASASPPQQALRNLWVVLPITISISYAPGGPFVSDKIP
jgi:hypothetical protein